MSSANVDDASSFTWNPKNRYLWNLDKNGIEIKKKSWNENVIDKI